jgi:hypothetical protein
MPSGSEGTSANDLDAGIGRGLEFLRRSQLPSGEFKVFMSPDLNLERDWRLRQLAFSNRAYCLLTWLRRRRQRGDVLNNALRFLLNLRACYR